MPLTNTQYDEIMRGYQDRQLARQRLIADRKKEVCAALPRFAELDGEIASLSVQKARRLLEGDGHALESLREQIASISAQRDAVLTGGGYPRDYLSPPYHCPDCKDTGYIENRRCHCLRQAAIDLVYAQSHLGEILETENFSTFSLDYYDSDVTDPETQISSLGAAEHALAKCRRFAEQFGRDYENLFLFGDTGTGKTFLSHCVARELLDSGHSVIYFSAQRLFDVLAAQAFGRDGASPEEYRNIFECDLLIIDDLGTELVNQFTVSRFFICLNERLLNRRPILISSNLGLREIASVYSERIFSRITDSFTLLRLFGSDIRVRKRLAGSDTGP